MKSAMALTENNPPDLSFISLGPEYITAAHGLSSEAGWNQTPDDWRMMLEQGTGFGMIDRDNHLIATAICLPYGAEFGWISMVLVHLPWRQKGLATQLLNRCITTLEDRGLLPVLDATPQGETVYKPLGFFSHFGLTRWQSDGSLKLSDSGSTRALTQDDLPAVKVLDRQVFGGSREIILDTLFARAPHLGRWMNDGSGFVLARDGRNASQIGPLVATSGTSAIHLLNDALSASEGVIFIDAVDHQSVVSDFLRENGFVVQRPFKRMAKGRTVAFGMPENFYAIAGPELG